MNLFRVAKWNKTAKRPQLTEPGILSDKSLIELRLRLLREEIQELEDAYNENNIVEVLDALCDIQVVLNGAVAEAGLLHIFKQAMDEVCDSNDSKFLEDGSALLREGDNKIMKGPNYIAPDLLKILYRNYGTVTLYDSGADKEVYCAFSRRLGSTVENENY